MSLFHWISGGLLGAGWFSRVVAAALGMPKVADITQPQWDRWPAPPSGLPRVSIIVPARNEGNTIDGVLRDLVALQYPNL